MNTPGSYSYCYQIYYCITYSIMEYCGILRASIIIMFLTQVITMELCPESLVENCTCSKMVESELNITCHGSDIVKITKELPPNTGAFKYIAKEFSVNLGGTDFGHTPNMKELVVKDPEDFDILVRKISPIPGRATMFAKLAHLQRLSININWEMGEEIPDLFKGLKALKVLDFSNTRLLNIDHLIDSLQGLKKSPNMTVLNLWNIKTLEHSAKNLEFPLDKVLEPLAKSKLKVLNIGYNAFRSITPGLIKYAPRLKCLIVRNNILIPMISSALMTEVFLHKTLEEADFSEQGLRPDIDHHPLELKPQFTRRYPKAVNATDVLSQAMDTTTDDQKQVVLKHKDIMPNRPKSAKPVQSSELPFIFKPFEPCLNLLHEDTCNIFAPECDQARDLLSTHHKLFCDLLKSYYRWRFSGIPCDAIPGFNQIISPNCGACLRIPTTGSLRKLILSHANVYDNVLHFNAYRGRPTCFFPNSSLENIDGSGNVPHGYAEFYKIFQFTIKGLERVKFLNFSYNAIEVVFVNTSANFPVLETLDISHNLITLAGEDTFLETIVSLVAIDLSHNRIKHLTQNQFSNLVNLRQLDLSNNLIEECSVDLSHSSELEFLDLSSNNLYSFPQLTMDKLNQIALSNTTRTLRVSIHNNNLFCICNTIDFVKWVQFLHSSNLVFVDASRYVCTRQNSDRVALHRVKIWHLYWECYDNAITALLTVIAGLLLLVYIKRFYWRYQWYMFNKTWRRKTYNQTDHKYDALVCYDHADKKWIDRKMKTRLKKYNICYCDEDIVPGESVPEKIYQFIAESRKCIVVLSKKSVKSQNNMFHIHMIKEKLIATGNDVVILIKLDSLPVGLDETLKLLMETRLCLTWHDCDEYAQKLFWEQFIDAIGAPFREFYDSDSGSDNPHRD